MKLLLQWKVEFDGLADSGSSVPCAHASLLPAALADARKGAESESSSTKMSVNPLLRQA